MGDALGVHDVKGELMATATGGGILRSSKACHSCWPHPSKKGWALTALPPTLPPPKRALGLTCSSASMMLLARGEIGRDGRRWTPPAAEVASMQSISNSSSVARPWPGPMVGSAMPLLPWRAPPTCDISCVADPSLPPSLAASSRPSAAARRQSTPGPCIGPREPSALAAATGTSAIAPVTPTVSATLPHFWASLANPGPLFERTLPSVLLPLEARLPEAKDAAASRLAWWLGPWKVVHAVAIRDGWVEDPAVEPAPEALEPHRELLPPEVWEVDPEPPGIDVDAEPSDRAPRGAAAAADDVALEAAPGCWCALGMNGGRPTSISCRSTPSPHQSAWKVYLSPFSTSGATYSAVPKTVEQPESPTRRAVLKSVAVDDRALLRREGSVVGARSENLQYRQSRQLRTARSAVAPACRARVRAHLMQILQRECDCSRNGSRGWLLEPSLLEDVGHEISARCVLHDRVAVRAVLQLGVQRDNEGVAE
eukprot:scaffold188542_cov30-Tisochrysis_lutea.AAC.1